MQVVGEVDRRRTGAELGDRKVVIFVEMLSPGCRAVMTDSPRVYAIQTA